MFVKRSGCTSNGHYMCAERTLHILDVLKCTLNVLYINRSEGFALTGYDIPGCVEDGAWMLWENSSVAVVVAHPDLGRGQLSVLLRLRRFRDARIDPSRQASTDGPNMTKSCRRKNSNIQKQSKKNQKQPKRE